MAVVSVVIIFLNDECFLEEAVQSLLAQDLVDWELVLVDDGSTDRSTQIARHFAATDTRIRYVEHPDHENRGMSASRNLGAARSTAPYISFLDSDDVAVHSRLAEQVAMLEDMPDVAMVVGAYLYWHSWDPESNTPDYVVQPGGIRDRRLGPPQSVMALNPLRRGTHGVHCGSALVRRSVFDAVGGYEEKFRGLYEDQAFAFKVLLRYPTFISSRVWLHYRRHDASCSGQLERASRIEVWRLRDAFFEWLQELEGKGWFTDRKVSAAVRRRRLELRVAIAAASLIHSIDDKRRRTI
jgi:glycosyltransferase involved in cell wall biosynthesis